MACGKKPGVSARQSGKACAGKSGMTCAGLVKRLLENQDLEYREFHASLLPNIDKKSIIGVRVPVMRKIAKEFADSAMLAELAKFLDKLPHRYFEENQVHLFVVERIRDFGECLRRIEQFLPCIDNWAVCDGKSPKALLKDEARFLAGIEKWLGSHEPYTVRFGVNMLMNFFLDARFDARYLKWVAAIDENLFDDSDSGCAGAKMRATDRYYVQMVVAWYFATALAKQWNAAFPYIEKRRLSPWIHAKAIQKACESYRITDVQKAVLRGLK